MKPSLKHLMHYFCSNEQFGLKIGFLNKILFCHFITDIAILFVLQRQRDLQVELHLAPKRKLKEPFLTHLQRKKLSMLDKQPTALAQLVVVSAGALTWHGQKFCRTLIVN